jgi:hypothetical protein
LGLDGDLKQPNIACVMGSLKRGGHSWSTCQVVEALDFDIQPGGSLSCGGREAGLHLNIYSFSSKLENHSFFVPFQVKSDHGVGYFGRL